MLNAIIDWLGFGARGHSDVHPAEAEHGHSHDDDHGHSHDDEIAKYYF